MGIVSIIIHWLLRLDYRDSTLHKSSITNTENKLFVTYRACEILFIPLNYAWGVLQKTAKVFACSLYAWQNV